MTWWRRQPPAGLIFHSNQGSQYCIHEFQEAMECWYMRSSMSRPRLAVMDWMAFYYHRRLHSTLGYLIPRQHEQGWYKARRKKAA